MVLTYATDGKVSVKTKTETLLLGDGVTIGGYAVPGAGEYDIASIQCEGTNLDKAIAYFLRTEELTLMYLSDTDTSVTKVDNASNTDILVVDVRSDADSDVLKRIIKAIEPFYVLLIGAGAHGDFTQTLGITPFEGSTLKITRSGLPLEGTFLVSRG